MGTDIKKRIERINTALFGIDAQRYHELCHCYNILMVSNDDLWEGIIAPLKGREINPEVQNRFNRPIPPDAMPALIERARRMMNSNIGPLTEDTAGRLMDEYYDGLKKGYIIPGGCPDNLTIMQKQKIREQL